MTVSEFKAWFEGYTEQIGKLPTQKQWARIKERVMELTRNSEWEVIIYRDRYRDYPYRPWWPVDITWTNVPFSTAAPGGMYFSTNLLLSRCTSGEQQGGNVRLNISPGLDAKTVEAVFSNDMAYEIGRDEAVQDAG